MLDEKVELQAFVIDVPTRRGEGGVKQVGGLVYLSLDWLEFRDGSRSIRDDVMKNVD